jgi:hypothetical protein
VKKTKKVAVGEIGEIGEKNLQKIKLSSYYLPPQEFVIQNKH